MHQDKEWLFGLIGSTAVEVLLQRRQGLPSDGLFHAQCQYNTSWGNSSYDQWFTMSFRCVCHLLWHVTLALWPTMKIRRNRSNG